MESRFCSWLMSPKPVWRSKCRTPTSRNAATGSRLTATGYLKKRMHDLLGHGLAMEGLALME
jgi:hypothetical protein